MIKFYDSPDEFKDNQVNCNAWVATAVIGSAVIGAGASIYGSSKAAKAQTDAARMGIDATLEQYYQTRDDLAPYREIGSNAASELEDRLPFLTSPIELTQDWLENTPGYEFTKTQGLKAVQNSAAARGLGVSGAALKGAANFATGLADNTYKTQFDVENINRTNAYSRLKSLVDTGQSASAATGTFGANASGQVAGLLTGAGNAQAAAWNSGAGAVNNAFGNIGGYAAYKGLYGGNPGASSSPAWGAFNSGNPIY